MTADVTAPPAPAGIEANGLNTIAESERRGRTRDLFWPWFASNVSVLGISYGSFILGFGISFLQATLVALIGVTISFALCGVVALAGRRGSAPTMLLSRAAFGVDGNRLASVISWVLLVGWETALTSLAVLATSTVFTELGLDLGPLTKIVALLVVAALTVGAGIAGFEVIMRLQKWITVITGALTVVYVVLAVPTIDLRAVGALPAGSAAAVIGALVFVMTGFGLGWVNAAADYSRYLPRSARGRGVFGWTTFGGAVAPIVLVVFGLLLAGSSPKLSAAIGADPIGALTTILPVWFLVPFAIVAILGLVGGSVLNIYSSGLALLSAGLRVPRYVAAGIDGVIMIIGAIYVAFFAPSFVGPFQAFLITLGVPIAAWCGVFIADVALRRSDYAEADLLDARGRYGSVRLSAVLLVVIGTALGWGLVVNGTPGFTWQGYLLGPLGGRTGEWAYANLGVLLALVLGFVGTLLLTPPHGAVAGVDPGLRRRRRAPVSAADAALVVIDMQQVFADPASAWATPRYAAAAAGAARLLPAFAGRTAFTRFVAPERPAGGWVPYYDRWPDQLQPPDAALWDLTPGFGEGGAPVVSAPTFGKWGAELAEATGHASRLVLCGVSTDCCVLSTALAAADAGVLVTIATDACAGASEPDHERALAAMALYAPLIELATVGEVLDRIA